MRALRFASVLGFTIESETAKAIHDNKDLLKNISAERLAVELSKLVCGKNAFNIFCCYLLARSIAILILASVKDHFHFSSF